MTVTSLMIVIINVFTCTIFEYIVYFERCHTFNDETMGQFRKITLMQFVNSGLIILLINFQGAPSWLPLPILRGEYRDFSEMWYKKVGKSIITTLLLNIFSPHASKLALALLKVMRRFFDRRFRFLTEKVKLSPVDIHDVNTRLKTQAELNELYTGD
jgi:hypothetical protein